MLFNNRVIWSDNGVLKDISVELNDLFALTKVIDFNSAQDKLYIGSDLPFNHRHFEVSVVNAVASVPSIKIWDGNAWVSAVDVVDQTAVAGATLAKSGIIQWVTDRNQGWQREDTTEDIAELSTLKIYDMYWVQVSFSVSFTPATALSYCGHKFSTDAQLGGYYPDLVRSALMSAFETSKTDWNEQSILAAEEIIRDLRKSRVVKSPQQINYWEMFQEASVHKTAEIINIALGVDHEDNRKLARERYDEAMNQLNFPGMDSDEDGHVDLAEKFSANVTFRRR